MPHNGLMERNDEKKTFFGFDWQFVHEENRNSVIFDVKELSGRHNADGIVARDS